MQILPSQNLGPPPNDASDKKLISNLRSVMPKARLKAGFRGPWIPLVNTIIQAINIISEKEGSEFELRLFGNKERHQVRVIGLWSKARGVTFTLAETDFITSTLTKGLETQLLLLCWRRSTTQGTLSYIYALHGKLRSEFLAGAIVDAVKLIGTGNPHQCFELAIDGAKVTKMNSELFEPCGPVATRFKSRG